MKMRDLRSRTSKKPCHIELEENTPLYLKIVKNVQADHTPKRTIETACAMPLKARWIPPPGKSTLKVKRYDKRQVQFVVKPLPRAGTNLTAEIPDMMEFIGAKVQQLENLISTLQEIINKNRIANERVHVNAFEDGSVTCVEKLSEKTEQNFLKLYQEQQHLINKCLEVIESSKATLRQSQEKSYVRDVDVQTQPLRVGLPVPVPVSEEESTASVRHQEMLSVRKGYFKIKTELEHLKKYLRILKQEAEKYKQQSQRYKSQLTEKVNLLKQLALERDRWKIKLTQMSNEKIEIDTQVAYLKSHLEILQNEAMSSATKNADQDILRQATIRKLAELEDENEKLKIAKIVLEDQVLDVYGQIAGLQNQIERLHNDAQEKKDNTGTGAAVIMKSVSIQVDETGTQKTPDIIFPTKEKAKESVSVLEQLEKDLHQKKMAIDNLNINLETKESEVNFLSAKLEAMKSAVQDEESKWRSKISTLETSLWSKKTEISVLRRERQQVEKNYLCKLDEVEKKLETAMSTNRSLQNYITLLRNTYATVFTDPTVSTLPMSSTFAL